MGLHLSQKGIMWKQVFSVFQLLSATSFTWHTHSCDSWSTQVVRPACLNSEDKFFTCVNTPRTDNYLYICTLVLQCVLPRQHPFWHIFLTIIARLLNFLYVWRHKHGTQLPRGVHDHTAEGIQAVHQADVDPRQGNISGFFLPLWVLLQNKHSSI